MVTTNTDVVSSSLTFFNNGEDEKVVLMKPVWLISLFCKFLSTVYLEYANEMRETPVVQGTKGGVPFDGICAEGWTEEWSDALCTYLGYE